MKLCRMELCRIAAKAANDVYTDNLSYGTTQYNTYFTMFRGCRLQVLAFAGTNQTSDWVSNCSLWSSKGVKQSSFNAATLVESVMLRVPGIPLLVTGHSKGGAEAIAYNKLFGATWCVAFCPARCLRYWTDREMLNTTIFIDPDDPVPKLACLSFGHPECNIIHLPNDVPGIWVGDHFMSNILKYLEVPS